MKQRDWKQDAATLAFDDEKPEFSAGAREVVYLPHMLCSA
jgi:hypothetical protein